MPSLSFSSTRTACWPKGHDSDVVNGANVLSNQVNGSISRRSRSTVVMSVLLRGVRSGSGG